MQLSESKKIKCGSSSSFSQLIKVHECQQDTITSHHETCHSSKSELSEAEPILSRDGNHWPYEKSSGTDGDLLSRGASHTNVTRVLVVCRFWSHLGCLRRKAGKWLNILIQVFLRAVHKEICKKGSDTDLTEISFKGQFKLEPHPHWPPSGV